MAGSALVYC